MVDFCLVVQHIKEVLNNIRIMDCCFEFMWMMRIMWEIITLVQRIKESSA